MEVFLSDRRVMEKTDVVGACASKKTLDFVSLVVGVFDE